MCRCISVHVNGSVCSYDGGFYLIVKYVTSFALTTTKEAKRNPKRTQLDRTLLGMINTLQYSFIYIDWYIFIHTYIHIYLYQLDRIMYMCVYICVSIHTNECSKDGRFYLVDNFICAFAVPSLIKPKKKRMRSYVTGHEIIKI